MTIDETNATTTSEIKLPDRLSGEAAQGGRAQQRGLKSIGFLFLVIAAWGLVWILRTIQTFNGEGELLFKIALVGFFVFMMGSFGLSSFWRARRISRHK